MGSEMTIRQTAFYGSYSEEIEISTLACICLFFLIVFVIVFLLVTIGSYFFCHWLNPDHWFRFIIPAFPLIACCFSGWYLYRKDIRPRKK